MGHLLVEADARRIPLADGSVHCVVTSPPYWGLRDYGTGRWEGGDPGCDHLAGATGPTKNKGCNGAFGAPYRDACGQCGARRVDSQLGLEATPEAYVARMVAVFREVWRVLRDDGTCWVNLGHSYANASGGTSGGQGATSQRKGRSNVESQRRSTCPDNLKPKDLIGVPWRVALALQADGWHLRSDIIWHKPNPMPESVEDRPTKSHEYVFLLSKRERYYYDAEAVRESSSPTSRGNRREFRGGGSCTGGNSHDNSALRENTLPGNDESPSGRNLRTVWTIATEAYKGAHFATFPRKLVTPCVKAGTSEHGVCPGCGAPWVREVERESVATRPGRYSCTDHTQAQMAEKWGGHGKNSNLRFRPETTSTTFGWRPTCSHGLDPVPATVLDPFAGSGTTLVAAEALGRRAIGLDLSRPYLAMARRRITRPHARTPRPAPREPEPMPLFDRNGEDLI